MRLAVFKRPKIFISILIALLLVMAIVLTIRNLNSPAVGTISQTPPSKAEVIDPYANPGSYSGKYISFTYPAHYKKLPVHLSGSYLEVADFYATDQSSKSISIGVLKENISDDSGVKLRIQQKDKYQEEPRTASGILIFTSTAGSSERTAFVPYKDTVATISLTAPPEWDLAPDMQVILNSLKWK